jgi:hypothetical protein
VAVGVVKIRWGNFCFGSYDLFAFASLRTCVSVSNDSILPRDCRDTDGAQD